MNFEIFRPDPEKTLAYSDRYKGVCPRFDPVLLFKIPAIQTLNNLSDERTEYLTDDRLSFMRFLGLGLSDRIPNAKTVWLFRERLAQTGAIDVLFSRFDIMLRNAGYQPMSGQILDATLVRLPGSAIPMLRKRIFGLVVFLKTGRTSRQSYRTRTPMHAGR